MDVAAVILAEQTARYRSGLCIFCGVELDLCRCGENEPDPYEPAAVSVDVGVE